MSRKSFTSPAQVAKRLFLRFPTLYVDAEHALADILTGIGNGREWYRGKLADLYGFDTQTEDELRAERKATDERWAREETERRQAAEASANEPDPEFDALFERIMADAAADAQRRQTDPTYAAEQSRIESAYAAARARQEDPTYRKQLALARLCDGSNAARLPKKLDPKWAAALRWLAQGVLALPEDFREATMPGQPSRLDVQVAKGFARKVLDNSQVAQCSNEDAEEISNALK